MATADNAVAISASPTPTKTDIIDIRIHNLPKSNCFNCFRKYYVQLAVDGIVLHETAQKQEVPDVTWSEIFSMDTTGETLLTFKVYATRNFRADEEIGGWTASVSSLFGDRPSQGAVTINRKLAVPDGPSASQQLATTLQCTLVANTRQMIDATSSLQGTNLLSKAPISEQISDALAVGFSNMTSAIDMWSLLSEKINALMTIADKIAEVHPYTQMAWSVLSFIPGFALAQMDRDDHIVPLIVAMRDIYTVVLEAEAAHLGTIALQQMLIAKMIQQTTECVYFIGTYSADKRFRKRKHEKVIKPVEEKIKAYEDVFKSLQKAFVGITILQIDIVVFRVLEDENHIAAAIDLNDMPYAKNARFNSDKGCLPGTHQDIISGIIDWVNHPIEDNFPRIFFLHGMAKSGKSAIAHNIAGQFDKVQRLGSSYFFDHNQSGQLHAGNLFSTISRDLADLDWMWKKPLWNIVKNSQALHCIDAVKEQFEKFFLQPGQSLCPIGPVLIVIDALDECPESNARKQLLALLGNSENIQKIPKNLRILITSRPEPDISETFQNLKDSHAICKAMPHLEDHSTSDENSTFSISKPKGPEQKLRCGWLNWKWHPHPESFLRASHFCLDGQITQRSKYIEVSGGYADIWTGESDGMKVAIKRMRGISSMGSPTVKENLLKRAWQEYLVWSSLIHPNILRCFGYSYDFGSKAHYELPALVSPWMSNGTVISYITSRPTVDRLPLIFGIADGLAFLHDRHPSIIHGDVRGENILVSDQGVPCLTGFGFAKTLGDTVVGLPKSSRVTGSLRWMSRELLRNQKSDKGRDIWAFGMTIIEILTAKLPYSEVSLDAAVVFRIMSGQIPNRPHAASAPGLTDELWLICRQCWDFDVKNRPAMRDIKQLYEQCRIGNGH